MHLLRTLPAALAATGLLAAAPTRAQAPPQTATDRQAATPSPSPPVSQATPLSPQTVTATRTSRASDDIPGTVTAVTAAEGEARGARDLKSLLADEPDLSIRTAPSRFTAAGAATGRAGSEGLNIRGLEGNQVLMLVDGIRVPNGFSFAAFSTGRGDYLTLDTMKDAEVLRGPASTQYGSDGLAGVLSLRTLDPRDLLGADRTLGGFVKLGYAQADDGTRASAGIAGRNAAWSWLVVAGGGWAHETENQGDNHSRNTTRTAPNPATVDSRALLAKVALDIDPSQRLTLTAEANDRDVDTEVYSARRAAVPPFVPPFVPFPTNDLDTADSVQRHRVSLEHRWQAPLPGVQELTTMLYGQHADTRQRSDEDRGGAPFDRTRDNRYRQNVLGLTTQAVGRIADADAGLPFAQRWSVGLDVSRQKVRGLRDGTVPPAGETFPVKPFPDTRYTLAGAYVQDELETESLSVIPALRFDRYKLSPSGDGYSGDTVTLSDSAVTPRLGVVWRLNPAFAPYAQFARGFRAPTPDQVNNGFTNLNANPPYESIGNPNLKAERARSFELGIRGAAGDWRWQASAYDNRYRDFISQEQRDGTVGGGTHGTVFQYVNLANARIHGWELRSQWQPNADLTFKAAVAKAHGETTTNGVTTPLNTIDPLRAFIAADWTIGPATLHAAVRGAHAKDANDIAPGTDAFGQPVALVASHGYAVLDLGASWKFGRDITLVANLNNVTDRKYSHWSDLRGLTQTDIALADAYTAPGRNAQVSVRVDF